MIDKFLGSLFVGRIMVFWSLLKFVGWRGGILSSVFYEKRRKGHSC